MVSSPFRGNMKFSISGDSQADPGIEVRYAPGL
jgi:hypothetical protein